MVCASLIAFLALFAVDAHAGQASDTVEGPVPEEVDAFRKARERFTDRMAEIDGDTRRYVDFREDEERTKLVGSYDALIESLEEDERGHRLLAVERFERFLERYPDAPYASHVRFRLADLYFEVATEEWLAEFEAFERVMNDPNASLEDLERMEEQGEPKRDLGPAIALYQKIIADNVGKPADERYERLDGTYVMLGFCYQDANAIQYDPTLARQAFADLIVFTPESELADRAHLFLGNYMFADGEFDDAMAEYEAVANQGDDSKYYMEALYQLAWARYKLDDFDGALKLFTELLDKSEEQRLSKGRESSYAPDARRFMAFSFADLSYDSADAVGVADRYFAVIGDRPYKRDVMIDLADVLIRYTRPEEAIAVYERLQEDPWLLEPDNPAHQIEVVNLYAAPLIRDLEKTGSERLEFIERYTEGTAWWEANRNDPEALEVARNYVEASLLEVAIEYRVRAQETGQPEDFAIAAQKYQEYLDKFPISDDYYEQQWTMADSLKKSGNLDAARDEYASLVRSQRYHPYGDGAIYSMMDVALRQLSGLPGEPPADGVVERSYEGNDGKQIDVYTLSADRTAFMEAADAVLDREFGEPEADGLPDFRDIIKEKGASILYITGQIPYYHNRFDEARPRLERVIEEYRTSIEASYAAGLLVDSYLAEGDYEKVRYYTKTFSQNPPGPPTEIDPERFKGTLEGTTFKLALDQADGGDYLGAADAFMAFRQEFPNSEQFSADALYNAAYYAQQGGKAGRSSELYEQFVREYPNDKRSKDLFFRIAGNYEQVFELDKAVENYRAVIAHPDATDKEKADAQFNASFLLIGLKRHQEAAEGFENYEARYDTEDEEDVYWLAGEQWEEVSPSRAITFYENYLRKFPDETPDHVIEAHKRLADLYEAQGNSSKAKRSREGILTAFDRFAREGKKIGANGHRYAAETDYPRLVAAFEDYSSDELSGNQDKDTPLLTEQKPKELKEFEAVAKEYIGRYSNFEYNSGALLLQARSALYLADLGLSIKCPKGFSEEECWAFDDLLQEQVFPQYYEIEEVGIQRLTDLVTAARDQKRHSRFIDEALVELNKRRPSEYPAVKEELEGGTDSTIPARIVPVSLDEPEPEPEPAPEEDAAAPAAPEAPAGSDTPADEESP